jgi:DNA-binding response OmpR family regulator
MKVVRQISHFKGVPINAVTAKAMKGDREKCSEAGAWDYLSKPVDPAQLLTVLRAWLAVERGPVSARYTRRDARAPVRGHAAHNRSNSGISTGLTR